jgi:hypothetical protein
MSGQKEKGFRVASGQNSMCINASASEKVHGAEPCVMGQIPLYACKEQYDVFYNLCATERSHVQGVRHFFCCRKRVGLGIGYNRLEVKDAKNKACT